MKKNTTKGTKLKGEAPFRDVVAKLRPATNSYYEVPHAFQMHRDPRTKNWSFYENPYWQHYLQDLTIYDPQNNKEINYLFSEEFRSVEVPERGLDLDLSVDYDLALYVILKDHPLIANSKDEVTDMTMFYFKDEAKEAQKTINIAQKKTQIYGTINNMVHEELLDFLRVFEGQDYSDEGHEMLHARALNVSEKNPEKVHALLIDDLYDAQTKIARLRDNNILSITPDGYFYGERFLGINIRRAATFIMAEENSALLESMNSELGNTG